MGQSLPSFSAPAPPDVRCATKSDQNIAGPGLIAKGDKRKCAASFNYLISERQEILRYAEAKGFRSLVIYC